jgi:hypothetical protein
VHIDDFAGATFAIYFRSFLSIKEQFLVLYTVKVYPKHCIEQGSTRYKNSTILFKESIRHGYNVVIKFLLSHDLFDPSVRDNNNGTAIQIASYYGCTEVVQLLLSDNRVDPCHVYLFQRTTKLIIQFRPDPISKVKSYISSNPSNISSMWSGISFTFSMRV